MMKMQDMARTVDEMQEAASPISMNMPKYDYGLNICFNQETLDKLDLEHDDVEVGDMIHLMAMATVTSVSKSDTGNGEKCRIELTLTHIGVESEDSEDE